MSLQFGPWEGTLQGHCHSRAVESLACLGDGRLASGSSDKTIKIWNIETRACERTLEGHTQGVCNAHREELGGKVKP